MPHYYVDLDNNKLVTGSSSTQLAPTPNLYQGDKPAIELELLSRTNGVLAGYTSAASAVNVRIGALGSSSVASALTLSVVTLSATGAATAGIASSVTATGLAYLLGSITATATAGLTNPVTGSISANFNQVQLPSIVPVLKDNQLVALEVPTCGNYFSAVPSVFVSEPDIFRLVTKNLFGSGTINLSSDGDMYSWPTVLSSSVSYRLTGVNSSTTPTASAYANVYLTSEISTTITVPLITMPANGVGGLVTKTGTLSVTTSLDLIGVLTGGLTLIQSEETSAVDISASFTLEKRTPEGTAQISSSLAGNRPSITINSGGFGYSQSPDIFVIPQPADYTLGDALSPSSASISGRTCVVTISSHGISTGSLVMVEALDLVHPRGSKYFGVKGIWPVVETTTNSITFRIDKYACHTSVRLSLSTSGSKIYPVNLTQTLTSASVSCAGSGYAAGTAIPFFIASNSCGGQSAGGTVSVSNSGQLSGITVTCVGSGFTSSSTVLSLTPYRSLNGFTVTCAGSGYWTTVPSVIIDSINYVATAPGASAAVITAGLNGDGTISLSLVSAGYGYTGTPSIRIDAPNSGDGIRTVAVVTSGVGYSDGTFSCTVSAAPAGGITAVVNFVKSGTSQSFSIVNPGRGYTSVPGVVVTKPNLGGQVSAFTVTCKGAGFLISPSITLTGGGGSGAAAVANIENGSITTISITTGGTGYTSAPAVSIDAPASSAYYKKQIDLSVASVATLLGANSSASAYLQIEEKSGSDTTILAQVPVTIQARIS